MRAYQRIDYHLRTNFAGGRQLIASNRHSVSNAGAIVASVFNCLVTDVLLVPFSLGSELLRLVLTSAERHLPGMRQTSGMRDMPCSAPTSSPPKRRLNRAGHPPKPCNLVFADAMRLCALTVVSKGRDAR
jgi:hypothetical protein